VPQSDRLVAALSDLGFSQYEARTYSGLLQGYGQTAYGLSKVTGVPQPKIYDALRKLVDRGAAAVVGTNPRQFAAIPPDTLFEQIRRDFTARVELAEEEAVNAASADIEPAIWPEVLTGVRGRTPLLECAVRMLNASKEKLYLSVWSPELRELAPAIDDAGARGVEVIVLAFGREPIELRRGQLFRHDSTSKMVYPHHQNRHLAMVCDGHDSLWAMSVDNGEWSALTSRDRRMVGLVRGFIRHDIYVQKTHAHFGPEMEAIFGPGLELLADPSSDRVLADRSQDVDDQPRRHQTAG